MADWLVEARGLHAYYGESHVLHGVNLNVMRGQIVALMGRNGMGKTTLLRTILGFVEKSSGTVKIKGRDMTLAAPYAIARCGIAYVPEGRGIFPNLSARENLVMSERKSPDVHTGWTLSRVLDTFPRLGRRLDHSGGDLSGGEQQMLSIGRALMTNPDLLVLDEATEGLAPLVAHQIWETIMELRRSGMAILVVDRNFRLLSELADKAVLLVKGRAVFDGSKEELLARPELSQKFLGV